MDKTHWLDEPRHVKLLWRLFLGILVLVVVIGALIPLHPHFDLESLFGFYAWFGFIACAVMILVAKGLALLIKRPDTYYRERDD
jgi:membrane protease YdiL (CAAX protease family)